MSEFANSSQPEQQPEDDQLRVAMTTWSDDMKNEESVKSRTRERWMRQQATETATFTGLLVDLSETDSRLVLTMVEDFLCTGHVVAVSNDFVLLRDDSGINHFIKIDSITSIQLLEGKDISPTGDRAAPLSLTFIQLIVRLAEEQPRVQLAFSDENSQRTGVLQSCGEDFLTLRTTGPSNTTHIPINAINRITLLDEVKF